jgi:hypothetical protein
VYGKIVGQNISLRPVELTPCSKAFLEKLGVPQIVTKFPTFYATRRYISVLVSLLSCGCKLVLRSHRPWFDDTKIIW